MTCGLLKWEAGVLTVEGARELFGRDVLIRDVPYEAGEAITCGSFPASELCACGVFAEYLCDYPLGKGKTCDAPLCATHAMPVGGQSAELMRPHDVAMRRVPPPTYSGSPSSNVWRHPTKTPTPNGAYILWAENAI